MKRPVGRYVLLLCCFFVQMPVVSAAQSSIKQIISSQEVEFDVLEKDMYTMVYADELAHDLDVNCQENSLRNAKQFVDRVREGLGEEYTKMSDHVVLDQTRELFHAIHEAHAKADALPDEDYCAIKYIFYDVQNRLREVHVGLLDATGIVNDFGEFQTEELYGYNVKQAVLKEKIAQFKPYKNKIGRTLTITHVNTSFDTSLSDNERALYDLMQELFESIIYYAIDKLQEDGIFEERDINQLEDTIVFDHQAGCGLFHGNYEIKETIDYQGNRVKLETNQLELIMNYCPNYFVLRNLDQVLLQLTVHELGHHVYYYNDPTPEIFEKICRSDGDTRKQTCGAQDFVSEYAQTYAVEDYADHFMYRYLEMDGYDASPALRKKSNHFRELFE